MAPGLHQSSWEHNMSQKYFDYWLTPSHVCVGYSSGGWVTVKEMQTALLGASFGLYLDYYVYYWKNFHLG